MQQKMIVVDGVKMRWEESGQGFPVVLIHGIPTSPQLWRDVVPLIGNARCLAWEMVGYGDSIPEAIVHSCTVARQATYLRRWLDATGIDKAILVGHDLGGGVAQILATEQRARCAALVLVNSIGYDSWPIPSVRLMRSMAAIVRRLPNQVFRQIFRMFLARGHDQRQKAVESEAIYWPMYARDGGAAAFVRQISDLYVGDTLAVADRLSSLHVPARIVWGAEDPFQRIEYGEKFARDLAAPLRRIKGGRHFVPEDHPEEVAEAIVEVLTEITPAAGPVGEGTQRLVGSGAGPR